MAKYLRIAPTSDSAKDGEETLKAGSRSWKSALKNVFSG